MKILLVEDDPDLQFLFAQVIEKNLGIEIVVAESNEASIQILKANSEFKGIICDFQLADGTALLLLNFIKNHPLEIPFILCSGNDCSNDPNLLPFRIHGHLSKPFGKKDLLLIIRKTFGL
jgi:CheY-like chemotaxis protein